MTFDLTQDQRDFAAMLRSFFAEQYGQARLRTFVDQAKGYDPALWRVMTSDLDLPGLAIAEEYGGSGASAVELAILLEEYGRALVSSPLLATSALAIPAIAHAGTPAARSVWLPRLASGETTATWALLDGAGLPDRTGAGVRATRLGNGWRLDGVREWVLDGATADVILTVAATPDGPGLFAIDASAAPSVARTACDSVDPTLALARVSLDAAPGHLLTSGDAADALARALALAGIALAAVQLGCLSATLDTVVSYAGTRTQFGRPIGGFQAVKHRCADVFIDAETTRWVIYHAAAVASDPAMTTGELAEAAHLTAAYTTSATFRAAANLLQVLGGIGYTWEHTGHLYFKRATATARLLGPARHHLDAISDIIDASPSAVATVGGAA